MPYLLRSWTDQDAGTDRAISAAVYPEYREEPDHPAWFPARQLGAPEEYLSRYVVTDGKGGDPVGYSTLWELRTHRYRFDLAVRPEWQRRGIASQLLVQLIRDAQTAGATGLQARVRDDKEEAIEFILRRGFRESHRMGAHRIDFAQMEGSRFRDAFTRLRDEGLEVTNLAVVRKEDSDYLAQIHELYLAVREGWADPDPGPAPTSAQAFSLERVKGWLDVVRFPDAFFIVKHEARYIAFTSVFDIGTGVRPEYRRKGIATLLKSGSLSDAQRLGFRGQTTSTASPAMEGVLNKLGYRRLWSEIRLIREMV